MKKLVSILLVLTLGILLLASCAKESSSEPVDPAKAILGSWESKDFPGIGLTYVFNEDGTGSYYGETFTYSVSDNKITFNYPDAVPVDFEFRINGDELIVKDSLGEDVIYFRK